MALVGVVGQSQIGRTLAVVNRPIDGPSALQVPAVSNVSSLSLLPSDIG